MSESDRDDSGTRRCEAGGFLPWPDPGMFEYDTCGFGCEIGLNWARLGDSGRSSFFDASEGGRDDPDTGGRKAGGFLPWPDPSRFEDDTCGLWCEIGLSGAWSTCDPGSGRPSTCCASEGGRDVLDTGGGEAGGFLPRPDPGRFEYDTCELWCEIGLSGARSTCDPGDSGRSSTCDASEGGRDVLGARRCEAGGFLPWPDPGRFEDDSDPGGCKAGGLLYRQRASSAGLECISLERKKD